MSKTFTIIGNCQTALRYFLFSNKIFNEQYKYVQLPPVHTINAADIIFNIIGDIDLLVIQPIHNNYKGMYDFGTYNIVSKTKPSCKIILFPSLHLSFYYPNCTYIRHKNNSILQNPIDYHDINLIRLCKEYTSFDTITSEFKKVINTISEKDIDSTNTLFQYSINDLEKRENEYESFIPTDCADRTTIIKSSEFIINNYKNQLLFYSMNHPTKYMFQYICNEILTSLNIDLESYSESIDPLLYNAVPILYKFIGKIVEFDISEIPIVLCNRIVTLDEFIKIYYDVYSKLDLSEYSI